MLILHQEAAPFSCQAALSFCPCPTINKRKNSVNGAKLLLADSPNPTAPQSFAATVERHKQPNQNRGALKL
jgi:hypothetical protein